MAVRATVNQTVQIGKETTHGTAVGAGKLLSAFDWTFGEKAATKQWVATGRKYPTASALLTEYAMGKISGHADFAACVYPISSVFGAATVALAGASSTVYGWTFTPPVAGAAAPVSYTVQQGNSVDDSEQYAYLMFSGFGYSFDRKQEVSFTGDWFSQTFTDGASLTSNPTAITLYPMTGAQANIYLDTSSGGLGGTQLTDVLKVDFKASDFYDQYWPLNRSAASFTSHFDKKPKNELKITMQANSTGVGERANYLQTGTKAYIRVSIQGVELDVPNTEYALFQHDMAVYCSDMAEFSDVDGVYAVEYTFQIAEDDGWSSGTAQKLLIQNLLSAL